MQHVVYIDNDESANRIAEVSRCPALVVFVDSALIHTYGTIIIYSSLRLIVGFGQAKVPLDLLLVMSIPEQYRQLS